MNRLPVNTILALAFLTLGTLALIGASIADTIALIGGQRQTDSSIFLLTVSVVQLFLGVVLLVLQWDVVTPPKEENQEKEKENDPS